MGARIQAWALSGRKLGGWSSTLGRLLWETLRSWRRDSLYEAGAALAFYALFSLVPLLLIFILLASAIIGPEAAKGQVLARFSQTAGAETARLIQNALQNAHERAGGATLLTMGMLLFAGTLVFSELQRTLRRIWGVAPPSHAAAFLRNQLVPFAMVLCCGALLLVSLAVGPTLAAVEQFSEGPLPLPQEWLRTLDFAVPLVLVVLVFGMAYKLLPGEKIPWMDAWLGALVAGVLFALGKQGLRLYLVSGVLRSTYGAASSVMVLLIWVFFNAQACLFGAELTKVCAEWRRRGGATGSRAATGGANPSLASSTPASALPSGGGSAG